MPLDTGIRGPSHDSSFTGPAGVFLWRPLPARAGIWQGQGEKSPRLPFQTVFWTPGTLTFAPQRASVCLPRPLLWKVDTHLCAPSGPKSGQACMEDMAQSQGWGEKRVVQGTRLLQNRLRLNLTVPVARSYSCQSQRREHILLGTNKYEAYMARTPMLGKTEGRERG